MPTADNYKPAGQASSVQREGWCLNQAWTPDLLHTPSVCCGLREVQDGSQQAVRQLGENEREGRGRDRGGRGLRGELLKGRGGWGTQGKGGGEVGDGGLWGRSCSLEGHFLLALFSEHSWPIRGEKELLYKSERSLQWEKSLLLCVFGYLLSLYQHALGGEMYSIQFLCIQRGGFVCTWSPFKVSLVYHYKVTHYQ